MRTRPRTARSQQEPQGRAQSDRRGISHSSTGLPSAQEVLEEFRDQFIEDVDPDTVVNELQHKDIIPQGVQARIAVTFCRRLKNQLLHQCLVTNCTREALVDGCRIIIAEAEAGNKAKMKALGIAMKKKLTGVEDEGGEEGSDGRREFKDHLMAFIDPQMLLRLLPLVLFILYLLCNPTVESVAAFRERLQTKYNMTPAASSLKDLKVPGCDFFQPLIYEAEEVTPDRHAVERLDSEHETIANYGRVMQAASGGRLVLLEGPPGSGKSTVSRQLCRDWAIGVFWTEFDLVVFVPLHELKNKTVELEDLLKVRVRNLPDGVVQHIEAVDGKGVLFILDGYDEIQSRTEGVPAVIEDLLDRSSLPLSSVIVTSRGIAAKGLYDKQHLHKRFVIQGLREDQIPVFVRYYFGGSKANDTEVQSLLDKLNADHRLTATCSNTVALSIVCYLHRKQESIPNTKAGLYGRFLVVSIKEFVKRSPEHVELPMMLQKYNRETFLQDLPSILHPNSSFSHLGAVAKLALDGILQGKTDFESNDKMVPNFTKGFDGYGLLDITEITDEWTLDTKLYRLNFMHSTMQEFMAALLVANWAPKEQAAFWREHFALQYDGHIVDGDRFVTMFGFYCGLTGLEHKGIQDHLLEEVENVWRWSYHNYQVVQILMRIALVSGNKEFVCRLLSPLGKKVIVDVNDKLERRDAVWCLNACKDSFEELVVVGYSGISLHTVADFLSQLNQLTSLSVLELPYTDCSAELSASSCSEDLQTILEFWIKQKTHHKSLRMKFRKSLNYIPPDLLTHIHEITLTSWYELYEHAPEELVSLLDKLPSLQILVVEDYALLFKPHSNIEVEDPLAIRAMSDAVKRHPKLIEVTVGTDCNVSFTRGLVKGVLQKADVRKVNVVERWVSVLDHYSIMEISALENLMDTIDNTRPESNMDDIVHEYLIPAMKRGSLNVVHVMLAKGSSVESVFRALPESKVEELTIVMDKDYRYSEEADSALVATIRAGLSESKTLRNFGMTGAYGDGIPIESILTSVASPLEEVDLKLFLFRYPGTLDDCINHLRKLSLKSLILTQVYLFVPYDISTLLVGGLGQNGTLEELEIFAWYLGEKRNEDVADEETLKAVEAAVRESTSIKRIFVSCRFLNWTNVATAFLKGVAANKSLRELTLWVPDGSPHLEDVINEVKQKRRKLVLEIKTPGRR